VTGLDVPGAGGWLVGAGELGGGGWRGTAWPCAAVTLARIRADTGPMTRTMRRGRRATLLLITGLLIATDLSVAEGVRAANPRIGGRGSSQHTTPKSRDPNADGMDSAPRLPGAKRRRQSSRRPRGGRILPESSRRSGPCSDGRRPPLVLGVGGETRVRAVPVAPARVIAGGTPVC
jgi:hypothetical protein